ncbi:MAG: type II toxin-antitoxin system VapC family toxin [Promethearchaeota archaeon]
MKIGVDTNVFLALQNKESNYLACKKILDVIQQKHYNPDGSILYEGILSTIVAAEILVGFYKKKQFEQSKELINILVSSYKIIPVSLEISKEAARLRGESGVKLPDAIIAMTYHQANADIFISNDHELTRKLSFDVLTPETFVNRYLQPKGKGKER